MRTLDASIDVRAPARFAIAFLQTYIQDRSATGAEPQLSLRVPLKRFAGGIALERPVTVELHYLPDAKLEHPALSIRWEPAGTKLFPCFDGTIEAQACSIHDCRLSIHGSYAVPFGVPGLLFDAVAGMHIARTTLDGLLREFQTAIEADYAARIDG
jgi:hypothetical protein